MDGESVDMFEAVFQEQQGWLSDCFGVPGKEEWSLSENEWGK